MDNSMEAKLENFAHGHIFSCSFPIIKLKSQLVKDGRMALVLEAVSGNEQFLASSNGVLLLSTADIETLTDYNIDYLTLSDAISMGSEGCFFNCDLRVVKAGEPIGVDANGVPIVSKKTGLTTHSVTTTNVVQEGRKIELSDFIRDVLDDIIKEIMKARTIANHMIAKKEADDIKAKNKRRRKSFTATTEDAVVNEPTVDATEDDEDESPL
tara:strand:+ start:2354 stop:2986 length:633 start_codon:yes stop_codon:yes gene_type:complete